MDSTELDGSDVPACPLLGLATDRRSHYTYPHPGHRCFAKDRAAPADAGRQATYCLSVGYTACDRYPMAQPPKRADEGPLPQAHVPGPVVPAFRIHVLHAGESLAAIAADHGLTADQVARANGLTANDVVANGARLVIPLGPPGSNYGSDP